MRLFVYWTISALMVAITRTQLSARETSYFAVASSGFGELYREGQADIAQADDAYKGCAICNLGCEYFSIICSGRG